MSTRIQDAEDVQQVSSREEELITVFNQVPLNRFMGLELIAVADGTSQAYFHTTEEVQTSSGTVNGCSYHIALEIAAGAAAISTLPAGRKAMTTDFFASVLRAAPINARIDVTAKVIKSGRSLVFVECEATCNNKIMATARVTKSVV